MIYLINVLGVWLLLTAAFAALGGWALAAEHGASTDAALRRERDKLVRDLAQLAKGESAPQTVVATDADAARSLSAIRESRIAELESALTQARSRADDASAQIAELQRRLDQNQTESASLPSPQPVADSHEAGRAVAIVTHAEHADEDTALQTWRLRYFEQRVRFLESRAADLSPALTAPAIAPPPAASQEMEWRAREAEARASYLAQEVRDRSVVQHQAPNAAVAAFAANPDVDTLLRWRLLYLERRTAHWQQQAVAPGAARASPEMDEPRAIEQDKWKWRARYLELRVRHLEQSGVAAPVAAVAAPAAAAPAPETPAERPPSLPAAQNGASDDLTLIEGVTPLQQSTLNSLGVYHFDQIAAWTPENVAWVDRYLRLRGRIGEEEWVEQAADLAREGPYAVRALAEHV